MSPNTLTRGCIMLFARGHCCSPHTRGGRLLSGRHAAVFRLVILKRRINGYFRKVIYIFLLNYQLSTSRRTHCCTSWMRVFRNEICMLYYTRLFNKRRIPNKRRIENKRELSFFFLKLLTVLLSFSLKLKGG